MRGTMLILHSVVYQDVTRQAKRLYRLKHAGARRSGLTYLSRCNLSWFCHTSDYLCMAILFLSFNKSIKNGTATER
jgi:hypothetical protein